MVDVNSQWIIIGQFGRVHGVQGLIRVHSFTQEPEQIFAYSDWHRDERNTWLPTERIEEVRHHQTMLVKVKGFETREQAMQLTNQRIAVQESHLPTLTDQEFYCYELVGMTVINTHQKVLGPVLEVLQTGANDVLVTQGERRHLIPFIRDHVIHQVCRTKRQIIVDWDEDF